LKNKRFIDIIPLEMRCKKMRKCRNNKVTFKPYEQNQIMFLDLGSMVPENHVVREINTVIEQMDLDELFEKYLPGGTSTYNPRMMLKVLIFAYSQKIFSSRKIADALRRDVYFMWLAGSNKPDFRTVNNFRSGKMKDIIENIMGSMTLLLADQGYINLEDYFLDGTKIEANANKYTFVWKGSTEKYKEAVANKTRELMRKIDELNKEEDKKYGEQDLPENKEITSEQIQKFSEELNKLLEKDNGNKEIKKAKKQIDEDFLPRMKKYEKALQTMGENRNSYSKTDTDATFMRMKEDYMKNGQLKPGYNVQIGTQNQFVVNTLIMQDRNDNGALEPMVEHLNKTTGKNPKNICADSGYGNEETYEYLRKRKIKNYVKFTYFHKEQKKKYKSNEYLVDNLTYDSQKDEYTCPANRKLKFVNESTRTTKTGYEQNYRNYECENCSKCELKENCTKAKGNRTIQINKNLNKHKNIVRANLTSKKGLQMRSARPVEVESVFGNIKWNMGFKRFLLRGIPKVTIEWSLLCLAHNFNKIVNIKKKTKAEALKVSLLCTKNLIAKKLSNLLIVFLNFSNFRKICGV
jgi:transposase